MARGRFHSFQKRPKEARRVADCWDEKEKREKKRKRRHKGKQINSSVGWSRVFSGFAPNICFARSSDSRGGIHTGQKRIQRNPENFLRNFLLVASLYIHIYTHIYTKSSRSNNPPPLVSVVVRVCVTPFPFDGTVVAAAKNTLATRPSRLLLHESIYPPRYERRD